MQIMQFDTHLLESISHFVQENLSTKDLLVSAAVLLGSWLVYKAGIEPFMSPLRKIPGLPYTNPLLGNLRTIMNGEAMEASLKRVIVEEYGPVVRYYFMFGRERLLVADPLIMKHIFITNAQNYVKPANRIKIMIVILGKGLVTSEGELHTAHKRLLSPAFSTQSISKMIPVFEMCSLKLADYWTKKLSETGSAVLPVHSDITRTTLDIIGLTAFGYDFDSLVDPDCKISVAFHEMLTGAGLTWRSLIPFNMYLPFPETIRFRRNLRIMNGIVYDIINKKRKLLQSGTDFDKVTNDVLGMMMVAHDEETGYRLSDEELRDHVMTLMLAGHETTAVGMAWCLFMLATHQNVQEKARDEILSVIGPSDALTYELIDKLEYCGCVVKETLRYYPPVPLTLRKAINADVLPGGYHIPAGTIMQVSVGPMMRRNEIYPDADSFVPERFMQKEASAESNVFNFAPFLYGPRQCLGYRFAPVEMRAMLAVLLRRFRFDVEPSMCDYKRRNTITMRPHPSLQLRVSLLPQQ